MGFHVSLNLKSNGHLRLKRTSTRSLQDCKCHFTLKKLHFDVIPKTVDDYLSHYNSYSSLDKNKQYDNPIWHIHSGKPKEFKSEINFNTLTNLVNVSNSKDKKVIWSFINKYDDQINADNNPEFDRLIDFALNYYEDFILPKKKFLEIDSSNKEVFNDWIAFITKYFIFLDGI